MQHVINRQIIELMLPSSGAGPPGDLKKADAAFRLQQQASDQFYRRMLGVLERVFDRLGKDGELISFDQLVVDLGSVAPEAIEDGTWTDELYIKLTEQAETQIREGGSRRRPMRRPLGAGIVEQWLAYMRTGRLPWNVTAIDRRWLELLLEHLAADHAAVSGLRECLTVDRVVRRIAAQHDIWFLVGLTEVLTARNQSVLPAMLSEVGLVVEANVAGDRGSRCATFLASRDIRSQGSSMIWIAAFRVAAKGNPDASEIVRSLLAGLELSKHDLVMIREELTGRVPLCGLLLGEMESRINGSDGDITDASKNSPWRGADLSIGSSDQLLDAGEEERAMEEGLFVPYAGMVLLHGFLGAFFTRVGLVADCDFADEAAQRRCLHLLNYVVTGESNVPEYDLVMARVLCGFPLEEPVEREFEPTPVEIEETEALLDACPGQWTKLGETSRAGLRESFLQRAGRLYRKDDRLRLDVERSSIDVLLDYLPWNISLIKLPWMKEMLHVNWR